MTTEHVHPSQLDLKGKSQSSVEIATIADVKGMLGNMNNAITISDRDLYYISETEVGYFFDVVGGGSGGTLAMYLPRYSSVAPGSVIEVGNRVSGSTVITVVILPGDILRDEQQTAQSVAEIAAGATLKIIATDDCWVFFRDISFKPSKRLEGPGRQVTVSDIGTMITCRDSIATWVLPDPVLCNGGSISFFNGNTLNDISFVGSWVPILSPRATQLNNGNFHYITIQKYRSVTLTSNGSNWCVTKDCGIGDAQEDGYEVLASGMIFQWGSFDATGSYNGVVSFNVSFPVGCHGGVVNIGAGLDRYPMVSRFIIRDNSTFSWAVDRESWQSDAKVSPHQWFAWGH